MFNNLKEQCLKSSYSKSISFTYNSNKINLIPIGYWILKNRKLIELVNYKRRQFNQFFLNDISKNIYKTKIFFKNILYDNNMCFFLIKTNKKYNDGIIGASYKKKILEIYFVLKLRNNHNIKKALSKIINFLKKKYKIKNFIVKVFSNNSRAKKLYFSSGFKKYKKEYLKKININNLNRHIICKKKSTNVNYFYETLRLRF